MFQLKKTYSLKDLSLSPKSKTVFQSLTKEQVEAFLELARVHQITWRDKRDSDSNGNNALYGLAVDLQKYADLKRFKEKKQDKKQEPSTWRSLLLG